MFKIEDGRLSFWQWDINQRLIVEDASITEVHFCNRTGDCSLVCEVYEDNGKRLVNVPNILLQDNWVIRVYAYCVNHTKIEEKFTVYSRSKPADYVYTETEIKTFARLEDRMDELEATVSVEGIAQAVEEYLIANPVEAGATAEEVEQIRQNTEDIEVLQAQTAEFALKSDIPDVSGFITEIPSEYITVKELRACDYASHDDVTQMINDNYPDLSNYITDTELSDMNYATEEYVNEAVGEATKENKWELVERVALGYELLTEKPNDWATNYANYYWWMDAEISQCKSAEWQAGKMYKSVEYEPVLEVARTIEPNGENYNFKKIYIKSATTKAEGITAQVSINYAFNKNAILTVVHLDAKPMWGATRAQIDGGVIMLDGQAGSLSKWNGNNAVYPSVYRNMLVFTDSINEVAIKSTNPSVMFAKGTVFEIWGVRS